MSIAVWFISSLVGWSSRSGSREIIVVLFCLEVGGAIVIITEGPVYVIVGGIGHSGERGRRIVPAT
jgi:hypothetical protein